MYNIFLSGDYHFGHGNLYKKDHFEPGPALRPEFKTAEEADEAMIQRHNELVKPQDRVYVLGDVCFHKSQVSKLGRLNGRLVLIKGNHDTLPIKEYLPYVDDIRSACSIRNVPHGKSIIMTHIPIHPAQMYRWKLNVHGHTHTGIVYNGLTGLPDPQYYCVCMEQHDYYPTPVELVLEQLGKLN